MENQEKTIVKSINQSGGQTAHSIVNNIEANSIQSQDAQISATKLSEGVYANLKCKECSTQVGMLVGLDHCPNCKAEL